VFEEGLLLAGGRGDASQADLAAIGGGRHDVGAMQDGSYRQSPHGESFDPLPLSRCLGVTHRA
jgi:hypothetical protein